MSFMETLIDDLSRICDISLDGSSIGGVEVLSSVINPLSLSLIYYSPDVPAEDLCSDFVEMTDLAKESLHSPGFVPGEIEIIRWIKAKVKEISGEDATNIDIAEAVNSVNSFAHSTLFYSTAGAIQIIASPATEDGKTMAIAISAEEGVAGMVKAIKEQFGDFVMVIYPIDLSIGNSSSGSLQHVFHLYNDLTESTTKGTIVAGDICESCGEFFTIYPGQLKFCCRI